MRAAARGSGGSVAHTCQPTLDALLRPRPGQVFSLDVGYGSVKKMIQVLTEATGAEAVQVWGGGGAARAGAAATRARGRGSRPS